MRSHTVYQYIILVLVSYRVTFCVTYKIFLNSRKKISSFLERQADRQTDRPIEHRTKLLV